MKYFVYILQLADNTFYKGLTNNLDRRFQEHINGKCCSTKHKRPLKLIYKEECGDRKLARKREKYWKSGIGREMLKKLLFN